MCGIKAALAETETLSKSVAQVSQALSTTKSTRLLHDRGGCESNAQTCSKHEEDVRCGNGIPVNNLRNGFAITVALVQQHDVWQEAANRGWPQRLSHSLLAHEQAVRTGKVICAVYRDFVSVPVEGFAAELAAQVGKRSVEWNTVRSGIDVRVEAYLRFHVAPQELPPVSQSTDEMMRSSRFCLTGSLAKLQSD
ncbi:unnamed protein product [Fusarium langsethiae]|nr:unnamed protein product [Fusarium langsethiae]